MHRRTVLLTFVTCAAASLAATTAAAQPGPSNLAAGVLDQTRQAQQAIASRDQNAASDHLNRALATVAEIERTAPAARPILVPVFQEVDTETTVTPVKKDAELKKHSSIRGVDGNTTTTTLNVSDAGMRLHAAQTALASGDWAGADAALAAIQTSVSSSSGPMPLNMALQNLELAKERVLAGKYHDAELPLKSAAQAIGDYEKQFNGSRAETIDSTRQAIAGYATRVWHDQSAAAGRIDTWIQMVRSWQ